MNPPEKHPTHRDLQTPSIHQIETTEKSRSARGILHLAMSFVIAGAVICISVQAPVLAKSV
jgi:hypothetical protein